MTCIVGLVDGGSVWIGGDSAGSDGWSVSIRADSKVFRNGPMLFGFTSSFRMGQLLRHSLSVPDHDPRVDDSKYMVTTFVDAVRDCLKKGGYAMKYDDGQEKGGNFLVGYRGKLFEIDCDFQVGEPSRPFASVGCGYPMALGSLFATEGMEPEARVRKALEAAEYYSAGVRGPFTIMRLEP